MLSNHTYLDLENDRERALEDTDDPFYALEEQNFFSHQSDVEKGIVTESIHIHRKAFFDAFNEALNCQRSYKGKVEQSKMTNEQQNNQFRPNCGKKNISRVI